MFGGDPWPYGVEANRPTLDALVRAGLEERVVRVEIPEHIKRDWRAAKEASIA